MFTEMEAAKKNDDHTAVVCPELSNHEIFEKWRVVDTSDLEGERREEFQQDLQESKRRYDCAFESVLSHTSQVVREIEQKVLSYSEARPLPIHRLSGTHFGAHLDTQVAERKWCLMISGVI